MARLFDPNNPVLLLDDESNWDRPQGLSVNEDCIDGVIESIRRRREQYSSNDAEYFARHIHSAVKLYLLSAYAIKTRKIRRRVVRTIVRRPMSPLRPLISMRAAVEASSAYKFRVWMNLLSPACRKDLWRCVAIVDPTGATDHGGHGILYRPCSDWGMFFASGRLFERPGIPPSKSDALRAIDLMIARWKKPGRPAFPERDGAAAQAVFRYFQFMSVEPFLSPDRPVQPAHSIVESSRPLGYAGERSGDVVQFVRDVEAAYGDIELVPKNSGAAWRRVSRLAVEIHGDSGAV